MQNKRPQSSNIINQYKNNYYINIQGNSTNPYSYFVNNYNDYDLNLYKKVFDNPYIESTNISSNDFNSNSNISNKNIISYKYYTPMLNIHPKRPINNYMPINHYNQNNIN